ncbi:unnamed protein product [Anisakis simplex]|uniref:Uncharacterized protein n=1 Tax=Anisakis simplex TaxID=6269 RepID=A0A0M3KFY6_ANISI|nr:unnamed protein product [Anisakis simplex]
MSRLMCSNLAKEILKTTGRDATDPAGSFEECWLDEDDCESDWILLSAPSSLNSFSTFLLFKLHCSLLLSFAIHYHL